MFASVSGGSRALPAPLAGTGLGLNWHLRKQLAKPIIVEITTNVLEYSNENDHRRGLCKGTTKTWN